MDDKIGRTEFWDDRWAQGKTGWHKSDVNMWLEKYGNNKVDLNQPKRIFVPLCGKSFDMVWLYKKSHTVIGVEAVEKPVLEFFNEHEIPFSKIETSYGSLYKSNDEKLSIHVGDLFVIDEETLGKFDVVWDRGSLVAIYIKDRERYSRLIKSVLAPHFRYLLSTIQYDGIETPNGSPRNIPHDLVEKLFGDTCKIEVLETIDVSDDRTRNEWKLDEVFESCLLLTPK